MLSRTLLGGLAAAALLAAASPPAMANTFVDQCYVGPGVARIDNVLRLSVKLLANLSRTPAQTVNEAGGLMATILTLGGGTITVPVDGTVIANKGVASTMVLTLGGVVGDVHPVLSGTMTCYAAGGSRVPPTWTCTAEYSDGASQQLVFTKAPSSTPACNVAVPAIAP